MKIKILGCGASYGVPSICGHFGDCDPNNPKNVRTRSACLIEEQGRTLLIDCGPEIRTQLLQAKCRHLDAILFSHIHYDHTGGVDDMRGFAYEMGTQVPAYIAQETYPSFFECYRYLIDTQCAKNPPLILNSFNHYESFNIQGIEVTPILQYHGTQISTGFRIGDFAYSTDAKCMDETGFDALKGVKIWVLGLADRYENKKHVHLDEALQWIERIKPERVYLTHMGDTLDYETLLKELPDFIRPCYDGMEFDV